VLGAGLLAAAGDVALAQAFPRGSLPVVSVLGSLDSVVSVLLARLVLRERLRLLQTAGITGALVGALLLAAS
jgi:drug/metabolite transporter (DMT)-like permease